MHKNFGLGFSLLLTASFAIPFAYSAESSKESSSPSSDATHCKIPAATTPADHHAAAAHPATGEHHTSTTHTTTVEHAGVSHTTATTHHTADPSHEHAVDAKSVVHAANATECKIDIFDPHVACAESQKVLDVLHKLVKAYSSGDMKTYEEYLDDHCTTFDEDTKKLVSGKANVLHDIEARVHKFAPDGPTPLKTFTIDQPFAKVMGDTAVVTFVAYREVGGAHPSKQKCHVTDVFVKRGETWKKLHYRGAWKKA
ncbi:MAG: nuclear transport factor 2 family protein [Candidatus Obscuribacterales bacterium]|nr:nuclear transport factor 2 family protein [Candidatus Obscuribacterales bacterium]